MSNLRQVGVDNQAISMLWVDKAIGVSMACFITVPIMNTKKLKASTGKLILITISLIFTSIWLGLIPFLSNYYVLMIGKNHT